MLITRYPVFKCLHRGQKGFTLIELLVGVAILGVLAAVIVPNLGRFFGRGKLEAANTEQANAVTAVAAYMEDCEIADATTVDGIIGPKQDTIAGCTNATVSDFILNKGTMQADYTFTDAELTNATKITNSKWEGLSWNSTAGWCK